MERFDDVRFTGRRGRRFDNIRINGALRQPFHIFQLERFFVEDFNKDATNNLTFRFWIVFAFQRRQETFFRRNVNNVQTKVVTEHVHHLLGFIQTQQAVINEDTGQVFTDRTVQQHCGD